MDKKRVWIRTSMEREEYRIYLEAKGKIEKKEAKILKPKQVMLELAQSYIVNEKKNDEN